MTWKLELWRFLDTEGTEIPYTERHSRFKEWRLRFGAWRLRRDRRYAYEGRRGMDAESALLFSFWHITGYAPSRKQEAIRWGSFHFDDHLMGGRKVKGRALSEWASIYARLAP